MMIARSISVVFGIGLLRPAPGTWGSLAALPMAYGLHVIAGPILLFAAIFVAFFLGWWATASATKGQEDHDPSEIVIDEVVGQWIAILPVSLGASLAGAHILALWPGWISAFVLFRLFDIWKPGPVGLADRRSDALGVMLDDVIAGGLAAMCVFVLAVFAHLGLAL
ncbi:MAG: phosphatidylglycerophosphatase A [Pseudomonadota bacterium]